MSSKLILYLATFLLGPSLIWGQDTLYFTNPSFEDEPRHSHTPIHWIDCGFVQHSPPDTGPSTEFRSTIQPADGQSFLVLVTRDNATWERVSGAVDQALEARQSYRLQLQLAKSPTYFSQSPIVRQEVNFAFPVRLRIWGAKDECEAQELLAQTAAVEHHEWRTYTLEFEATQAFTHLIFEAYYRDDNALPYPGNLCIDGLSPLVPTSSKSANSYEARQIPPPFIRRSIEEKFPVRSIDQARLRELLNAIEPEQVEQGLYALAVYQRSLHQSPWTIYVKQDGSKAARRFKRRLRKQIAAMNLKAHLSVDDYVSVFQTMQWLCTPVDGGLGIRK